MGRHNQRPAHTVFLKNILSDRNFSLYWESCISFLVKYCRAPLYPNPPIILSHMLYINNTVMVYNVSIVNPPSLKRSLLFSFKVVKIEVCLYVLIHGDNLHKIIVIILLRFFYGNLFHFFWIVEINLFTQNHFCLRQS